MDLGIIFGSVKLSNIVLRYTGIIESSLNVKLDKLMNSELDAGIRALQQASTSENEQVYLLREARSNFNKAISLENDERLVSAYLGLAICHHCLGDKINCNNTLRGIYKIRFDFGNLNSLMMEGISYTRGGLFFHAIKGKSFKDTMIDIREEELNKLKSDIRKYLGD